MHELQSHYNDTSEGSRRKQIAIVDLKKTLYKNETTFTFQNYVKNINRVFNELEKYCVPLYKEQMVEHLLDHIMSP